MAAAAVIAIANQGRETVANVATIPDLEPDDDETELARLAAMEQEHGSAVQPLNPSAPQPLRLEAPHQRSNSAPQASQSSALKPLSVTLLQPRSSSGSQARPLGTQLLILTVLDSFVCAQNLPKPFSRFAPESSSRQHLHKVLQSCSATQPLRRMDCTRGGSSDKDITRQGSAGKAQWLSKASFVVRGHLGKMAPQETHVIEQTRMMKRTAQGNWIPRQVALTKTAVHLARDGQREDVIIDTIPLDEVKEISLISHHLEESSVARSNKAKPASTAGAANRHGSTKHLGSADAGHERSGSNVLAATPSAAAKSPGGSNYLETGPNDFHHMLAEENAEDLNAVFHIKTTEEGFNSGRVYIFKAASQVDAHRWIEVAKKAVVAAIEAQQKDSRLKEWQARARQAYNSDVSQGIVILLIAVSFFANIMQAQLVPEDDSTEERFFWGLDLGLTLCFVLELLINMFGHWMWDFLTDGWSMFDLLVVIASVVALLGPVVGGLSVMRVVRAFRALRIIGKLRELRRIVHALASSLFPVINALFIGAVVNCVFAIIAVQFFREKSPEHFGNFLLSLYTMFIMALYEAPFDDDLKIYDYETKRWDWGLVMFFGLFILIEVWTLLQVMVAVLLDHFISASSADRKEEAEAHLAKAKLQPHALDPILENISTRFHTSSDLDKRIQKLFERLDVDSSQSISFDEMRDGLKKIQGVAPIYLSRDEFESMIHDYESQFETKVQGDELSKEQFRIIMRRQLKVYIQRSVANTTLTTGNEDSKALLSAIKLSMLEEEAEGSRGKGAEGPGPRQKSGMEADAEVKILAILAQQSAAIAEIQNQMEKLSSRLCESGNPSPSFPTVSNLKAQNTKNGDGLRTPEWIDMQFEGEYEIPTQTRMEDAQEENKHAKIVDALPLSTSRELPIQHLTGDLIFHDPVAAFNPSIVYPPRPRSLNGRSENGPTKPTT